MKSFWFRTLPSISVFYLTIHTRPLFITNTFHSHSPIWAGSEDMWLRPEPVRGLMKCSMVFEVLLLVMWFIFWCPSGTYLAWGWRKVLWEIQIYWRIRKLYKLMNMVVTAVSFSSPPAYYVDDYLIKAAKRTIFGSTRAHCLFLPPDPPGSPCAEIQWWYEWAANWLTDWAGSMTAVERAPCCGGSAPGSAELCLVLWAVVPNSNPVVFCPENLEQPKEEQAETRAVCVLWEYSTWDLKAIMELGAADLVTQSY